MSPKKNISDGDKGKRKTTRATIEVKKEIIGKYENGVRVSNLASTYGIPKSTISTFLKNKEILKAADVAKGSKGISKQRPQIIEEVEKLLLVFINEKQLKGDSVSEAFICEKALNIYGDLVNKIPGASSKDFDFNASRGWFEKFKKRSGIHSVLRHGEAASSNKEGAEKFKKEFSDFIKAEGLVPQQVFNGDETGLFWKKLPNRTFITKDEKALPGHKPMKDRFTLLMCGNASGDFKVKPLLVYHSDNPRVFKRNNVMKSKLPVMWRANAKAWVTRKVFTEWMLEVFAPSVKKYLQEKGLPLKCLLLLDNAPAHPPDLEADLVKEFDFIQVKFLPPNTTPILQPIDQQVISNFKKLYTKGLFRKCFEITNDTELTLKEFWKNHFHVLNAINLIDSAWNQVSYRTMNSAWKKLWPECVIEQDFDGPSQKIVDDSIIGDIVTIGQSMGLEVNADDIEELVEDHSIELTTEELKHLQNEQKTMTDEIEEKEEDKENASSALMKEMISKWIDLQNFVEKYHPDTVITNRMVNMFNDNVMAHFRKILKCRQKQQTLEKFLVKRTDSPKQISPEPKRQRTVTEEDEERDFPEVTMEEGSTSKQ